MVTRRVTRSPKWKMNLDPQFTLRSDQCFALVRRMIFNVKSGNRDDHSKNFSFLLTPKNEWHLAPAYELTPCAGLNGEHTAMVNGKGRDITDADLIATAATCGVPESKVRTMIAEVEAAIKFF